MYREENTNVKQSNQNALTDNSLFNWALFVASETKQLKGVNSKYRKSD